MNLMTIRAIYIYELMSSYPSFVLSVFLGPVLLSLWWVCVGVHGWLAWGPLSGADLTELVGVLVSLDESEDLIDVSADWEIVDWDVSDNLVLVDDVGGSEGNSIIITVVDEAAVGLGDFLGDISNQGDVHLSETSLLSVFLGVFHVWELGIDGDSNNLTAVLSELLGLVWELADLSGAHEGEIEWVEEENNVLSYREPDVRSVFKW